MNRLEAERKREEILKLQAERRLLERTWWKRPEWSPVIIAFLTLLTALAAGFFSKESLVSEISTLRKSKDSLVDEKIKLADSIKHLSSNVLSLGKAVDILTNDTLRLNDRILILTTAMKVRDNALARNKFFEDMTKDLVNLKDQNRDLSSQLQQYQKNPILTFTPSQLYSGSLVAPNYLGKASDADQQAAILYLDSTFRSRSILQPAPKSWLDILNDSVRHNPNYLNK